MSHKRNNANSDSESYPELEISSKNTSFIDLKRCFKFCVKDMSKGYLDEKEDSCSLNCINKYHHIQAFLTQKMNNELNKLILMDPKIKHAFTKDQQKRLIT